MEAIYDKQGVTIYHGDCVRVMRGLPDNSVDSIVTDPPYGIRFMGKAWDGADIEKQTETRRKYGDGPSPTGGHNSTAANAGSYNLSLTSNQAFAEWTRVWSVEAFRILKPGGHMLVFCGPRTYHRMASGVEDAGFEIRDQIMWIYGSGFPKSLDIGKAIDKAAGVKFKEKPASGVGFMNPDGDGGYNVTKNQLERVGESTPEAQQWDGWGTALKPAHEPIVVARKPISGTVAENVLQHGTGGINIDGGRVENKDGKPVFVNGVERDRDRSSYDTGGSNRTGEMSHQGRFPANIILDAEAGAMLDKQSGQLKSGDILPHHVAHESENRSMSGKNYKRTGKLSLGDSGGASRFFYCAKASKADRDDGLELIKLQVAGGMSGRQDGSMGSITMSRNIHPTVKPTALMQYLVRLVTPPDGIVLDPFMGSGSTGKAAVREGFKFIGCDREAEYIKISIARIEAPAQVELL